MDTYADAGTRALLARAREARNDRAEGIESYEARLRERMYAGLRAFRFRRERGLFQQERVADVRWSRDGDYVVRWEGARAAVPITGLGTDEAGEFRSEYIAGLGQDLGVATMALEPGDDRLAMGDDEAVHPLADSAAFFYRFSSGDTLRVTLPADGRVITLIEARVEPREARVDLVAGSLWFEQDAGALVRATYKPARAFDLELDEPEEAEDVPGFLKPIRAEIDYITVDYSFHDFRWWLPRRFAFEGNAQLGRFLSIPITLEWTMSGYVLNEAESDLDVSGPLPAGWTRSEIAYEREGQPTRYVTVIVPPEDSVATSSVLSDEAPSADPITFSEGEIQQMRESLEALLPEQVFGGPSLRWGLRDGLLRYNRIEGLSAGSALGVPLGLGTRARLEGRIGLSDLEPNAELSFLRGPDERQARIGVYRRLAHVSDFGDPFSLGSSVSNVFFDVDRSQFYRTLGGELALRRVGRRTVRDLRFFYERHRAADKETDFHIYKLVSNDDLAPNLMATEGTVGGVSGSLAWHAGLDPTRPTASGVVRAEAGWGDLSYQRAFSSVALTSPLFAGLAGAVEVGGGYTWGAAPPQRQFYIGGPRSLRGFRPGDVAGESFWMARAEIANELPAARTALFIDTGWAGPRDELRFDDPRVSAGVGLSLLDGIVRFDLARVLRGGNDFFLHAYLDGLF